LSVFSHCAVALGKKIEKVKLLQMSVNKFD